MRLKEVDRSKLNCERVPLSSFEGANIGVKVDNFLYEMFKNLHNVEEAKKDQSKDFENYFDEIPSFLKNVEVFIEHYLKIAYFKKGCDVNKITILKNRLNTSDGLLEKIDGYIQKPENYQVRKEVFMRHIHNQFLDCFNDVFDFVYKDEDPFFRMKYNKCSKHAPDLLSFIKNKVFVYIYHYEDFLKIADPIFERKLDDKLNKKVLNPSFLKMDEINHGLFILDSNVDFDKLMKKGLPKIKKFRVLDKKIVEKSEILEVYIQDVTHSIDCEHSLSRARGDYRIEVSSNTINFYSERSGDLILYFDKESAKNHYSKKLQSVKKDIERLEKELSNSIASF